MKTTLLHRAMPSACVAFLLVLGAASSADAADVFWQGRQNRIWDHFNPGARLNNWYTRLPLKGVARQAPEYFETAVFAPDAEDHVILSDGPVNLSSMRFLSDTKRYTIWIREGHFRINTSGLLPFGIVNQSPSPPRLVISDAGTLSLIDASIKSQKDGLGKRAASIKIYTGGRLAFTGVSKGGDASATNEGSIVFKNGSSADNMAITNIGSFGQSNRPATSFHHESTGGNAVFVNGFQATLDFSQTLGPAEDRNVSARFIANNGDLFIGENTLTVDRFQQTSDGHLNITILSKRRHGSVEVKGKAVLGGRLEVFFEGGRRPGEYTILEAEGGRVGTFTLGNANMGRLAYSAKEVKLIVD
jgi:hypothetical protein